MPLLVREASRTGIEVGDEVAGCRLAVLVERRDFGAISVGLHISGPSRVTDHTVILAEVTGTERDGGSDLLPSGRFLATILATQIGFKAPHGIDGCLLPGIINMV